MDDQPLDKKQDILESEIIDFCKKANSDSDARQNELKKYKEYLAEKYGYNI